MPLASSISSINKLHARIFFQYNLVKFHSAKKTDDNYVHQKFGNVDVCLRDFMKIKKSDNQLVLKPLFLNEQENLESLLLQRLESKNEFKFEINEVREELANRLKKNGNTRKN